MNYSFKCSMRTINIDDPKEWARLCGDELSELLCEDFRYIRWMSYKDIKKMEGLDIATVLSVYPILVGYFYHKIFNTKCIKKSDWNYLLKYQPQFSIFQKIIDKAKE